MSSGATACRENTRACRPAKSLVRRRRFNAARHRSEQGLRRRPVRGPRLLGRFWPRSSRGASQGWDRRGSCRESLPQPGQEPHVRFFRRIRHRHGSILRRNPLGSSHYRSDEDQPVHHARPQGEPYQVCRRGVHGVAAPARPRREWRPTVVRTLRKPVPRGEAGRPCDNWLVA